MNQISPHAFIGAGVELGNNVIIAPGAVLLGPCVIEDGVWIGVGAKIGSPPEITSLKQNSAWDNEMDHAGVRIKKNAVIRENVVIHQGSHRETTVGDGSWVLSGAYLAHDVIVGSNTTVSAGVAVGGHAKIGDHVNIGMNASIHQRRTVGAGAMVGMGTPVSRDVPPFSKVFGSPPRLHGVNSVALERAEFSPELAGRLLNHYSAHGALFEFGIPTNLDSLHQILSEWIETPNLKPVHFAH